MSPVGVGASRFASALETGVAKFWVLLIGVDRYHDLTLPSLRYAAVDCQGIGTALAAATGAFPEREFLIHHDLGAETPTLARVEASLHQIVTQAQPQDTVLIYFSGHGVVEPTTGQTILCVRDTDREHLLSTGLQIQVVLEMLGHCAAHSQLLWLDACHSGNLNFIGNNLDRGDTTSLNPIAQLLTSLRHQAALSRGFYALLSCDEGQQSWEFPDLGHGVFSYYLMRGLQGEAADDRGIVDADSLYRYVYRQTVQYIDSANQQLRSMDRQQRDRRGTEVSWCPEYSAQTPKRIVSGVGEIILGLKPKPSSAPLRAALIVAAGVDWSSPMTLGTNDNTPADLGEQIAAEIGIALQQEGKFTLDYFPAASDSAAIAVDAAASLRQHIQSLLAGSLDLVPDSTDRSAERSYSRQSIPPTLSTRLLYLRGQITAFDGVDAWFVTEDGVKLSRAWLQQQLHSADRVEQIIILDCPGANVAAEWIAELQQPRDAPARLLQSSQCIIAGAALAEDADIFGRVFLEVLISASAQLGSPITSLCTRLETNLEELGIPCLFYLSGTPDLLAKPLPESLDLPTPIEPNSLAAGSADLPDGKLLPAAAHSDEPEITVDRATTQRQVEVATNPSSETLTVFTQNLAAILSRLVGPIAPTLLKACATSPNLTDREPDPATLVQKLLPLLPERVRGEFEQQVGSLIDRQPQRIEIAPVTNHLSGVDRSATKIAPAVPQPPASNASAAQSYFPPAARQAIAQTLTETIGPVAEVLLGQIAPTAWTNDLALLAALTPYLSADRLAEFAQRLEPFLVSPTTELADRSPSSAQNAHGRGIAPVQPSVALAQPDRCAPNATIDNNFTAICERELTQTIGPVAKFIIASTYKNHRHSSRADFVKALAATIPDRHQAEAFCHKIHTL